MLKDLANKFKKKSLKERFLLAIGALLFLIYLFLGLMLIFWKEFPLNLTPNYRLTLGVVLIVYSFLRFFRFFTKD